VKPTPCCVRQAVVADAPSLAEIYNQALAERSATFETEPRSSAERSDWIASRGERHPILVAESAGEVVGWTSISPYRARACYDGVGEFSVYVDRRFRGAGVGKRLLVALIDEARRIGYWKLVSRVFASNQASRALCTACGFREVGIYEKHGKLDGRWVDCVIVERIIEENLWD